LNLVLAAANIRALTPSPGNYLPGSGVKANVKLYLVTLSVLLASPLANAQQKGSAAGTLLEALGNRNGIVVMTDSILTWSNGYRSAGQKLFQYNDRLVCAVAGMEIVPVGINDRLKTQTLGLVERYRDEDQRQTTPSTMDHQLSGLSQVIRWQLEAIANIKSNTNDPQREDLLDYRVQLILAGYDLDGQPKIGIIEIDAERFGELGQRRWRFVQKRKDLRSVAGQFVSEFGGIRNIARSVVADPSKFDGPAIGRFALATSQKTESALTVGEMKNLELEIMVRTVNSYPDHVGKGNQVAIIRDGRVQLPIDFGENHFEPLVQPLLFSIFRNMSFGPTGLIRGSGGFVLGERSVALYEDSLFADTTVALENSIF
jgi:hypothetical protein